MQRLALSNGGRRVLHKNPSAIRPFSVSSNAEPSLDVTIPHMPINTPEELLGTPDGAKIPSNSRMAPRVNTLGDIPIPLAVNKTSPSRIKFGRAPTKQPQSSLNYLSIRLAKRQSEKLSVPSQPSAQDSNIVPPAMPESLKQKVESRKLVQEKAAGMIANRSPSNTRSHDVNARNELHDDQRRVAGHRPRHPSGDLFHREDGQGVNARRTHQRGDANQSPSTSRSPRHARGRKFDSHHVSLQAQDQRPKETYPSYKHPSPSRKNGGNKHIFADSPGFSEMPDISETNFQMLFGEASNQNMHSGTFSTSKRSSRETAAFRRTQVMLEEVGGDYSRYLPPRLVGMDGPVDPVAHAYLTLARRRDVSLKARDNVMKIINASAGGNNLKVRA